MKRTILILSILLTAISIHARSFEAGERIYVNADQYNPSDESGFNWRQDGAVLFLYLFDMNGSQPLWLRLDSLSGQLMAATIPSACDYTHCIVVRKDPINPAESWDNVWNQTGNIVIDPASMYLVNYSVSSSESFWLKSSDINASTTLTDELTVCSSAFGGPFSLHPNRLNAARTDYEYSDIVCGAWYVSLDGTNWTFLENIVGDLPSVATTLPTGNEVYYYLHSRFASGCRRIHITGMPCVPADTIASFEVVPSDVNANDSTYTLDGMVTFTTTNGDLVIECGDSILTIPQAELSTPQTFSLPGLRAKLQNGISVTAKAYFSGNLAKFMTATFTEPNTTIVSQYMNVYVHKGTTIRLNTDADETATTPYIWFKDGQRMPDGTARKLEEEGIDHKDTIVYTYRELSIPTGNHNNIMNGGTYEGDESSEYSDYTAWGKYDTDSPINFYSTHSNASNGFATVKNANLFHITYASVSAHQGEFFGLFDAAVGEAGGNKRAWYAMTATSPNLKIKAGTTYLFSFWAANINNYGEMDNAAKLQFQITYTDENNNTHTEALGTILDLNAPEYRNNLWHQCSSTYKATRNANNVTIQVMNLNTSDFAVGNDFALDDIQFRAVSSEAAVISKQVIYTVMITDNDSLVMTPHTICDNEPFTWRGHTLSASGTYRDTVKNAIHGVSDSIYVLPLTVYPTYNETLSPVTACDQYVWDGRTYTTSGNHGYHYYSVHGCDSIVTLPLTIYQSGNGMETHTACDSFIWKGTTYTSSGMYTFDTLTVHGCDSTVTLNLTIYQSADGSETHTACDSFIWKGTTYTSSGSYTFDTLTVHGCDSIVTLNLTIHTHDDTEFSVTECTSYVWAGKTFTASGDYSEHYTNQHGCDSISTLHLTITGVPAINLSAAQMICQSDPELQIAFTTTAGIPDSFVLSVPALGLNAAEMTQAAGVLSYMLPATIDAGDYAATIEVGTKGVSCTTIENVTFTVALTGYVYTKWSDVLLVDNSSAQFVQYQWFDDNGALTGETKQYLNTDSLTASGGIYYCQLTANDGSVLYTCPASFNQLPRSADQNDNAAAVHASKLLTPDGLRIVVGEHIYSTQGILIK